MTTAEPDDTGPQIAPDAAEPDTAIDDTGGVGGDATGAVGDGAPSVEDYEQFTRAVAQVMGQPDAEGGESSAEAEPPSSIGDQELADYVSKLRRQDARKRVRLQETETQLHAARQENERLSGIVEAFQRGKAEQSAAAQAMVEPADLWRVADLGDVLNNDGTDVDAERLQGVIASKVPAHWLRPAPNLRHSTGLSSGATGQPEVRRPASWAGALGHRGE